MNKVTAKKYLGDDRASWAVFVDGRPVVTGLQKSEVAYYRRQIEQKLLDKQVTDNLTQDQKDSYQRWFG